MRVNLFHLIPLVLLALLMLLLSACTEDKQPNSSPTPSTTQSTTPLTTPDEQSSEASSGTDATTTEVITAQQQPTAKTASASEDAPDKTLLALAQRSGCMACHAIDRKVVGPAWKDIAKRYAGDAGAKAKLMEKVAKGGRGNWTEVVGDMAMPPYSPRVSAEDIEKLVNFVLSFESQ